MSEKVIVAMSGGVDSSVTAAILLQEGYEVEGVFMKNWNPEKSQSLHDCPWLQDQADAEAVCDRLGIAFRSVNFEREYYDAVVGYFLKEYAAGRTPNPDIICNKEIKFKAFLHYAQGLGAGKIATGHYARQVKGNLYRGLDANKDQSYFLYALDAAQLGASLFPLGEFSKPYVRQLAYEYGLPTASKKDSQGICFVGQLDLKRFLAEHLPAMGAEIMALPLEGTDRYAHAVKIGEHSQAGLYTIGERVGGIVDNRLYKRVVAGDTPPLFVVHKEPGKLYVTSDPQDPLFFSHEIYLEAWEGTGSPLDPGPLLAQVRYGQRELARVTLEEGGLHVSAKKPLRAVAPGQSLVCYTAEGRVVGGGTISHAA
jgi:tRNA-specific 2-thiouridylase